LAREAVRKSLVLLKNGNSPNQQFLPLPKKARRILVAGTHANNLGYQCGGWSIQWMGDSGNITTGMCIFFFVLVDTCYFLFYIHMGYIELYKLASMPLSYF
jgi:beta-glucosidase-like glycosyl hydrolase